MAVFIVANGFELTQNAPKIIEGKFENLREEVGNKSDYRVNITKTVDGYECKVVTHMFNKAFTVTVDRDNFHDVVDSAVKAIKDAMREYKDKIIDKRINSCHDFDEYTRYECNDVDVKTVTRHKEVHLTPVSDDEAIEMLNKTNNNIYIYLDDKTLELKAVYERADGYGVITFKAE